MTMNFSARAIIPYKNQYLVVRNSTSDNFWCLPGGKIESGELVSKAIERELVEETGVKPVIGVLLFIHQFKTASGYTLPSFLFHIKNGQDYYEAELERATHAHELAEITFKDIYTLDDFRPYVLPEKLKIIEKRDYSGPTEMLIDER